MKHIIVFCYIFTILIGVSALTIQWLAGKGDKEKAYSVMRPFIMMLLFMNVYDFYIYYIDNIISGDSGNLMLSFGDCLIAVLVLLWLKVEVNICSKNDCDWVVKLGRIYVIAYLVVWLIAVVFFRDVRWIRLVIDIPLMILLIVGSAFCIKSGIKSRDPKRTIAYKMVITIFMGVNYITYFINESGMRGTNDETILDLTIFFWLVINAANMVLLYKRDFSYSYLQQQPSQTLDEEAALALVKAKYELTKRESEILKEIYEGKTNTQIADDLFISESTVKAHVYNLFRKLQVKNRIEAVCIVREVREK